jgi:hypothetical protein
LAKVIEENVEGNVWKKIKKQQRLEKNIQSGS